jgi:hypothetical protein
VGRNGREAHVDRLDRRPLSDRFGGGGRLRLVTLAAASAYLALSAAIPAAEALVSPQYQAKTSDTGPKGGATGPAADPTGGSDPQGRLTQFGSSLVGGHLPTRPPAAAWYRTQNARYQLHQRSSRRMSSRQNAMSLSFVRWNGDSKTNQIDRQIVVKDAQAHGSKVISSAVHPGEQVADARLLLRLGIALGLAYLVFLVAWFWTTRDRRHGVTRVMRF